MIGVMSLFEVESFDISFYALVWIGVGSAPGAGAFALMYLKLKNM
jgi:hypothetical protein